MACCDVAPGLAFSPPDHELTDVYLRGKIAGQPVPITADFIHGVDLYSAAPENLARVHEHAPGSGKGDKRVWYFFTTVRYIGKNARGGSRRKSRTIGGADGKKRWHAETALKPVEGSAIGGKFQKFSYKVGSSPGGWLMTEYSIHGADSDMVLCKVYKSPRASPSGSSSSSSCTTTAALSGSGCKRKAAGDHPEAPATAWRQRKEAQHEETEEDEAYSCVWQQSEEDIASFRFSDDPTPVADVLDVLASSEDKESYMQGGEPAVLTCTPGAKTEEDIGFSSATDDGEVAFVDAGVTVGDLLETALPQFAPHAATEEDAGLSPGADGDKIVLFDAGVTVYDLLDTALGERNDGLPCPEHVLPSRNELFSASGNLTSDATNGDRDELLSAYVFPPGRDEEHDSLWWLEAAGTSPLFTSAVDSFWGNPQGSLDVARV